RLSFESRMVQGLGGIATARAVNRELVGSVDVLLGNEEDLAAALGYEVEGLGPNLTDLDPANFARMIDRVVEDYPNLRVVATTLRGVTSASRNDWGAILWADGAFHQTARVH
ncbi:MAG TPA: hypothetical protein VIK06_00810, partial [Candidatus Limnocylindrales bacterium]